MKRLLTVAVVAGALLMTSGCATRIADLTVTSTKNVEFSHERELVGRAVEGVDTQHWFLFIPLGSAPNLEEALDDGLESVDGDFYTSVVIYDAGWWIPFVYGQSKFIVKGDVWRTQSTVEAMVPMRGLPAAAAADE